MRESPLGAPRAQAEAQGQPGDSFAQILQMHRLPEATDVTEKARAVSDTAKLRTATESHPLESIDAISRLRMLEKQEMGELQHRKEAWYSQDLGVISKKVLDTAVDSLRDVWDLKAATMEDLLNELFKIFMKEDRAVYLIIFGIIIIVLLRAHSDGIDEKRSKKE